MAAIPIGKAEVRRPGTRGAILSFGTTLEICLAAGEKFDFHVINMRFVKPLDEQIIDKLVEDCELIITVEENVVEGGAGSAVNELVAKRGGKVALGNYGLPDRLIPHGSREDMLRDAGLTEQGLIEFISEKLSTESFA
jgi:1-deoxy-D-xylulose-5-phosphate synthase